MSTHCINSNHCMLMLRGVGRAHPNVRRRSAKRGGRCSAPARFATLRKLLTKGRAAGLAALAAVLALFAPASTAQSLCADAGNNSWGSPLLVVRVLDVKAIGLAPKEDTARLSAEIGRYAAGQLARNASWEGRVLTDQLGGAFGRKVASTAAQRSGLQIVFQEDGKAPFMVVGEAGACTGVVTKGATVWLERTYAGFRIAGQPQ
jgi:hypothetical protein